MIPGLVPPVPSVFLDAVPLCLSSLLAVEGKPDEVAEVVEERQCVENHIVEHVLLFTPGQKEDAMFGRSLSLHFSETLVAGPPQHIKEVNMPSQRICSITKAVPQTQNRVSVAPP